MNRFIRTILTLTLLVVANVAFSQTIYSVHYNPQAGYEYDTSTTSGCANCQIIDPANAADTSTSDASRIMVQGGSQDEAKLSLLLTDSVSAGGNAGIAMIRSGTANATVLNAMKLTTYLNGVQQETATGNALSTYVINSSTGLRAIEFTSTKTFDEVAITLEKLGSGVNWADIYFAYGNNSAPLPVELTDFHVVQEHGRVSIKWTTASEFNNSYFIVQKSINGTIFTDLDNIKGYGNTNTIKHYSAMDNNPQAGFNYYRLVQVDYDGQETISKTVAIEVMENKDLTLKIYPNPAVNTVNISFSSAITSADIKLGDMMGNILVNEKLNSSGNAIQLDVSTIKPGTYIVYIFKHDGTLLHKQLITKTI